MTPRNNPHSRLQSFQHWWKPLVGQSLLISGVSAFGVFAVLGSGDVFAQASDPTLDAAPLDSAPVEAAPSVPEAPAAPVPDLGPVVPESLPSTAPIESAPNVTSTAPASGGNERFIDSTDYSLGATDRTTEQIDRPLVTQPPAVAGAPTSVQVGPVTVGSYGGFSVVGQTTPSVRDYYNRTIRPPGRLGNGNIKLIFPLSIPAPISSIFGWRIHPVSGGQRFHSGTDLAAPLGTPVLAAYAGQVALADFLGGYGLAVALEHNKGTQQTLYAHLSEIFVKPGEMVKQGTVIGRVGSTGLSTGPHLHFEFRQLTPDGWTALDAGGQLEYALAQLVRSLNFAQAKPEELGLQRESNLGVVNLGLKGSAKISLAPSPTISTPSITEPDTD